MGYRGLYLPASSFLIQTHRDRRERAEWRGGGEKGEREGFARGRRRRITERLMETR